ncbi:hypothetical protein PIB30_001966 [Stylosanthes scabra]|uniref:Uncharacterized protein n=1 Tax=Stylosanthes scabra TaxID=79078 RepID=A0ABU6Z010_9FABA|nr:hypothetical protein [Stylosanthes scabra]
MRTRDSNNEAENGRLARLNRKSALIGKRQLRGMEQTQQANKRKMISTTNDVGRDCSINLGQNRLFEEVSMDHSRTGELTGAMDNTESSLLGSQLANGGKKKGFLNLENGCSSRPILTDLTNTLHSHHVSDGQVGVERQRSSQEVTDMENSALESLSYTATESNLTKKYNQSSIEGKEFNIGGKKAAIPS